MWTLFLVILAIAFVAAHTSMSYRAFKLLLNGLMLLWGLVFFPWWAALIIVYVAHVTTTVFVQRQQMRALINALNHDAK